MSSAIVCRQLYKQYQSRNQVVDALNGVDLAVERGECFGLLGPNGAGKTTAVEILEGLLEPTSGEVQILGRHWNSQNEHWIRQRIGLTLQESRFQEKLKVIEVLQLFRSFYETGMEPEEALEIVSLAEKASAWMRDLSGGQKQRVAVATALVGSPELLFLDEPTTGLDPQARRQLWEVIENLKKEGSTILVTTHYMDEAEKLCDRVAIIDRGVVIDEGSPKALISRLGGDQIIEVVVSPCNGSSRQIDLERIVGVNSVQRAEESLHLTVEEVHVVLPSLLEQIEAQGWRLENLATRHANLEDVFVNLTGRQLRDD